MGSTNVSVDSRDRIVRLTLSRPERENSIDAATVRDVQSACEAVPDDARVVLLTADGDIFSLGGDADVAGECELESGAYGIAVECADDGLWERDEAAERIGRYAVAAHSTAMP